MRRYFILTCFILLLSNIAVGQQSSSASKDPLANQQHLYQLAKPASSLFVHFDKTIYTNNETVWFSGYLINAPDVAAHRLMSVALVRNTDSTILKQQKFLMASGLSFGSMRLPDSLLAGDYHFIASTNRVSSGIPDVLFIQPIIIKTNIQRPFSATIKMLETGSPVKKTNQILLSASAGNFALLPKPVEVYYRYGRTAGKTKTDAVGQAVLKLDEQQSITDPNVYVKLKYGRDSSFLNLPLPITKGKAKLGFFPEGGHLVNGIRGLIAWEAKDQQLAVLSVKAQLLKNGHVIDTIETNDYGIGRFLLDPEKGSSYTVKLMHSGFADSSYILPSALDHGIGLRLATAAVTDTLMLDLKSYSKARFFIRVHNFRETYVYSGIVTSTPKTIVKVSLETVPKGLAAITITDSLHRPIAERMFFAHYEPVKKISLSSDQQTYGQRKKVTLKIKLNGPDSLGIVSVACVQNDRLPTKLGSDIESNTYLASQLSALPPAPYNGMRAYENSDYIEDLMLVKGWRKYSWQEMMSITPDDTLKTYDNTNVSLRVSRTKKALGQPVPIALLKPDQMLLRTTDEHGKLEFDLADIRVEKERPIYVFMDDKNQYKYQLKVNDPYLSLNKTYLKIFSPQLHPVPSAVLKQRCPFS